MKDKTIAFVGLGAMGLNSAKLLARAGFRVQAFDLREEALQALAAEGGIPCKSAAEAVQGAATAVVFVVNGKQAEQVIFGPQGFQASGSPALTVISCVTMLPAEAENLGARCAERGWTFIDAPVSGGMVGAAAGTLTIMAGGERAAIEACRPVFETIGKRLMPVGDKPGQGSMVKTINQLLCGVHLAAAGEAMALAKRAGLDLKAVFEVVSQSAASSWMLNDRGPRMVADSFDVPTSAVEIFVKDVGIVLDVARGLRFPVPLTASALQSFMGASGKGLAAKDDAAVMKFYEDFAPASH